MLRKWISSCCIWYLYVPHLYFLRFIGPYPAVLVSRLTAMAHEISTYFGSQRRTRLAIGRAFGSFRSNVNQRTILRRYLVSQHQRFVEWYLYPTRRGRRFVEQTYQDVTGIEHVDVALAQGRGVIILVFHFGMAKMMWPALKSLGYESYQHVFRGATFAGKTFGPVARLAMKVLADTERNSGLNMVYHRPFFTLEQLYRLLRRNQIVGMNGDGMMGSDFITLPFLGGTMQFPRGPARLAARAGAQIIPAYAIPSGFGGHSLIFHPPLSCSQDKPEQVDQCVKRYVEILEDYVRSYPWEWWTWRRLDVGETEEGQAVYNARALGAGDGSYHAPQTTGQRRVVESG